MEKGVTKIEGNHCQNCGKYTLFLIDKYNNKLCPDCANNKELLIKLKFKEEDDKQEKKKDSGSHCQNCGEEKKDVKFRRKNHLRLRLCDDCLKKLTEYQAKKEEGD